MCGLTGYLLPPGRGLPQGHDEVLAAMSGTLRHRGPDDGGTWHDAPAGIGLGHRRLAILDLSPDGHQPMESASGRYIVAYNGEIYNFRALGQELRALGHRFRGHGDTEILLAAVEQWGPAGALPRLAGMFALALWDRQERRLLLARDRLGKKPLYLALDRGALLFASELKALHAFPGFKPRLDPDVLALYLRHGWVPEPHCIFEGALKLPPGSLVSLGAEDLAGLDAAGVLARTEIWWSARAVAEAGQRDPLDLSEAEATDRLEAVLRQAVAERMVADVPLGAFLSGGIDSSTVVALMQAEASQPVQSFSIGFEQAGYDEAVDARRIAGHLGTRHTELYVTASEARSVVPDLATLYDEPFADASQIPTHLVARLARQEVTVALTGDGGDEAFGGYRHHTRAQWLGLLYQAPHPARRLAGRCLASLPPAGWDRLLATWRQLGMGALPAAATGEGVHNLALILGLDGAGEHYRRERSHWQDPAALLRQGHEPSTLPSGFDWQRPPFADLASCMMYLDTVGYLPGDVLAKVDRASMAVGLEVRCPLLDHRVVELAWQLPPALKIRGGQGKWILRQVLARHLPPALFERPKQGFAAPVGDWLRGPLRDWAEDLLDEQRLREEGLLEPAPIRRIWAEHLSGRQDHGYPLWVVLMFQAWRRRWLAPA